MLGSLERVADEIVLTRPSQPRSADPAVLAAAATGPHAVEPDPRRALAALRARSAPEDVVLVIGSSFLVGEVLPDLDPRWAADAERERTAARLAGRG
jgi:folylpolyglutamate synthase/dihydropteroate synthase